MLNAFCISTLQWKSADPVPQAEEKRVARLVSSRKGCWGHLDSERTNEISEVIDREKFSMNLEQALSLRYQLLVEKQARRHRLLQEQRKTVLQKYKAGHSVLALSRAFDFPPMAVFRAVIAERDGLNPRQVKDALKSPNKLGNRDQDELKLALENDLCAKSDQRRNEARAGLFEDFLCNYLSRNKIHFRRQNELAEEQAIQHGAAIATPDFLLDEPIFINETKISWLDAKNCYGPDCNLSRSRISKQVAKYVKRWGTGAIVFAKNFCDSLKVPGALLLGAPVAVPITVQLPQLSLSLPILKPQMPSPLSDRATVVSSTSTSTRMQGPQLLHRTVCILWPLVDGNSRWCTAVVDRVRRSKKCHRGSWFKYGLRFNDEKDKLYWSRLHHLPHEVAGVEPELESGGSCSIGDPSVQLREGINSRESIDLLMPTCDDFFCDSAPEIPAHSKRRRSTDSSTSDITSTSTITDYDSDITINSAVGIGNFKRRCFGSAGSVAGFDSSC